MSNLNGIIEVKRKISAEINIDVPFITDVFIDGNEVVFTVLGTEKFVADWKDDTIVSGSTQFLKSYEKLEEVDF